MQSTQLAWNKLWKCGKNLTFKDQHYLASQQSCHLV